MNGVNRINAGILTGQREAKYGSINGANRRIRNFGGRTNRAFKKGVLDVALKILLKHL